MKDGKKLTASQRSLLMMNGIPVDDMVNWRYIKTDTVSGSGNKSSSKNDDKIRYMIVQNINTQEVKRVEI